MLLFFKTKKAEKIFNSQKELQKHYGDKQSQKIMMRLAVLKAAANLAEVPQTPPERRHRLKGKRQKQFALDLVHPFRLILTPKEELSYQQNGEPDLEKIIEIVIEGVENYHDK